MVFEIKDYDSFKRSVGEFCEYLLSLKIGEERVFDSRLVVHELLGNVLQHSGGSAWLRVELSEGGIELYIRAEKIFCPPSVGTCPELFAERGRGLYLVDKVSIARSFTEKGEIFVRMRR